MRKVALLIETSNRYGRDLLYGVRDWMQQGDRWRSVLPSRRGSLLCRAGCPSGRATVSSRGSIPRASRRRCAKPDCRSSTLAPSGTPRSFPE